MRRGVGGAYFAGEHHGLDISGVFVHGGQQPQTSRWTRLTRLETGLTGDWRLESLVTATAVLPYIEMP